MRTMQDMYKDSKALVRCVPPLMGINLMQSHRYLKLTCSPAAALSPFLSAVILDCMTREVQREAPWDILFADDVVVCSETMEEVKQRLEMWREVMEARGVRVSRQKTEFLKLRAGDIISYHII